VVTGMKDVPPSKMRTSPHKYIGALTFNSYTTQQLGKGTAVLIHPDIILTCAHNIYDKDTKEQYHDHMFYPAQDGPLKKGYAIVDSYFPAKYV
jgi:V8-like Glu-specific endopeptidase